ncbi:MAG: thermonuclease family protein [Candidatus Shapirobacteria bacterium]|jgi:micrococcal nuclease
MKFIKKFGGLFLLILIIGLIIFLIKCLVDKTKESILIKNKIEITPTEIVEKDLVELIRVVDGDTIIIKINGDKKSIRLIGIDTPETNECFGKESAEKIKELIGNKKIKLEADNSQDDKDKYDRLLRYVYLDDGILVNKKLIEEGMAEEFTYKTAYKFQTEFKEVEKIAKERKVGMWANNVCKKF